MLKVQYSPLKNYSLLNTKSIKPDTGNETCSNKEIDLNFSSSAVYNVHFGNRLRVPTKLERYEGCLLGGAIGDAFGAPLEKLSTIEIKYKYKGDLKYLKKQKDGLADFTDDTQMTLFTIEGLIGAVGRYSEDSVAFYKKIYNSYQNWYKTQFALAPEENAKGLMKIEGLYKQYEPGYTCLTALKNGEMGTVEHPINNSAGNGGVMRVAPVGLLYKDDSEKAFSVGMNIAAMTHGHPDAYLPAGYFASLITEILNGKALEAAIENTNKILAKYPNSEILFEKINLAQKLAKSDLDTKDAIANIGSGWTGSEALAIALYTNLKTPDNYKRVIITAANHDGDSDTTAAIAGNIAGALNGSINIPKSWTKNIYLSDLLKKYSFFINQMTEPTGLMSKII